MKDSTPRAPQKLKLEHDGFERLIASLPSDEARRGVAFENGLSLFPRLRAAVASWHAREGEEATAARSARRLGEGWQPELGPYTRHITGASLDTQQLK